MPSMDEWRAGVSMLHQANETAKARQDEKAVQSYLSAMQNGEKIDSESKDFNALAHNAAQMKFNEMMQSNEQVKQARMKTTIDQINTNHTKLMEAAQYAQGFAASGDEKRAKDTMMAIYNDLIADGHKLGYKDGKVVLMDPQGNIKDNDFTLEEGFAQLRGMMDKDTYAKSWMASRAEIKATNREILNNPDVMTNKDGKQCLVFKGLRDKNTGEVSPTQYKYKGMDISAEMARDLGFKTDDQKVQEAAVTKAGADARKAEATASQEEFQDKNKEEAWDLEKRKTEASVKYYEQGGDLRDKQIQGKYHTFGKYTVPDESLQDIKDKQAVLNEKLSIGKEISMEQTLDVVNMMSSPNFQKNYDAALADPKEMEKFKSFLKQKGMEFLLDDVENLNQLF